MFFSIEILLYFIYNAAVIKNDLPRNPPVASKITKTVINIKGLTKFYKKNLGISNVSFEVNEGEVFGYLGPNGAGKTTTIRVLMDFIRSDAGTATIFGLDSFKHSREIHEKIGYLPGELSLYHNLKIEEYLNYFGNLKKKLDWPFIKEMAERLNCNLDQQIKTLSSGNKQKVGLIQAFMHKPELIILDEPTKGLDPLMQQEFFNLVEDVKSEGRTILLSSHVLSEVERVCDRVGIIRKGKIIAIEDIADLHRRRLWEVVIHFNDHVSIDAFSSLKNLRKISLDHKILKCRVLGNMDELIKCAAKHNIKTLSSHQPSLEEIFIAFYGENDV